MSTPTPSVRRLALGDLEHEMAQTRRVLERVPEEHLDWQPHAKSFSLGKLAAHVANLPFWGSTILATPELDLNTLPPPDPSTLPRTREALLSKFDGELTKLVASLDAADDAALMEPWTLRKGDHVVMTLPRMAVIRTVGVSHLIHDPPSRAAHRVPAAAGRPPPRPLRPLRRRAVAARNPRPPSRRCRRSWRRS